MGGEPGCQGTSKPVQLGEQPPKHQTSTWKSHKRTTPTPNQVRWRGKGRSITRWQVVLQGQGPAWGRGGHFTPENHCADHPPSHPRCGLVTQRWSSCATLTSVTASWERRTEVLISITSQTGHSPRIRTLCEAT